MKTCLKCNQKEVRYGQYKCGQCRRIYLNEWTDRNREQVNKASSKWRMENPEKRQEVIKRYENKNKDERLARRRELYLTNSRSLKKYKSDPHIRRGIKNKVKAKLFSVSHEKYDSRKIFERDSYKCSYCNSDATELDHVLPLSRGGPDIESNLVACCKSCNRKKHNKHPHEWMATA